MGVRQAGQWMGPDTSAETETGSVDATGTADEAVMECLLLGDCGAGSAASLAPTLPTKRGLLPLPSCDATVATKNSRSAGDIIASS
jgi:hypothetical protein